MGGDCRCLANAHRPFAGDHRFRNVRIAARFIKGFSITIAFRASSCWQIADIRIEMEQSFVPTGTQRWQRPYASIETGRVGVIGVNEARQSETHCQATNGLCSPDLHMSNCTIVSMEVRGQLRVRALDLALMVGLIPSTAAQLSA
jgi:hypothetical protein